MIPSKFRFLYGGSNKLQISPMKQEPEDAEKSPYPQLPTCPYCEQEMTQRVYDGKFGSFHYWECGCDELPEAEAPDEDYG